MKEQRARFVCKQVRDKKSRKEKRRRVIFTEVWDIKSLRLTRARTRPSAGPSQALFIGSANVDSGVNLAELVAELGAAKLCRGLAWLGLGWLEGGSMEARLEAQPP